MGLTSAVITTDTVRVYPSVERPTGLQSVNGEILDVAIDSKRGVIYLLQGRQQQIAVMTTATMRVTTTVRLPSTPTDMDLTGGGDSLIVTFPALRALGIIDLRQATPQPSILALRSLDPAVEQWPKYVRVTANGKAFVSLEGFVSSAYGLLDVDLATGVERLRTDAGAGGIAGGRIERSHDHSTLVFTHGCFQRYEAATDAFGLCRTPRIVTQNSSLDANGQHFAISLDVYNASLDHLRQVESVIQAGGVLSVLSADGQYLYHSYGDVGLIRSRVSDGRMLDRTLNPIRPTGMRVSADGAFLVTFASVNDLPSVISVIDLR